MGRIQILGLPDNHYCYSQFCSVLRQHYKAGRPSLSLEHHPGDKLYIDFAGKLLSYIDKETGEEIPVQVFCCMPPLFGLCFCLGCT